MKSLDELLDESESGWLLLQDWISKATSHVEILALNQLEAKDVLYKLQISTQSLLGTVAYDTSHISNSCLSLIKGSSLNMILPLQMGLYFFLVREGATAFLRSKRRSEFLSRIFV